MLLNDLLSTCVLKATVGASLALEAPGLEGGLLFDVPVLATSSSTACLRALPQGEFASIGGVGLVEAGSWRMGVIAAGECDDVELNARDCYSRLLVACRGWRLCRVWNFLPLINQCANGIENYRAFCAGRSRAFEAEYGPGKEAQMSAASCVGSKGGKLGILFLATRGAVEHLENPLQVPAYAYPRQYGPRAPSFARATIVRCGSRVTSAFVSGTAAIRGHSSCAPGDLAAQTEITIQNIRELLARLAASGFDAGAAAHRDVLVYLRHSQDLEAVAKQLGDAMFLQGCNVTYLEADICRQELDVEIEMTLTHADGL